MCVVIFLIIQAPETTYLETKGTEKCMVWLLYKYCMVLHKDVLIKT